jgi:hypothetical protein
VWGSSGGSWLNPGFAGLAERWGWGVFRNWIAGAVGSAATVPDTAGRVINADTDCRRASTACDVAGGSGGTSNDGTSNGRGVGRKSEEEGKDGSGGSEDVGVHLEALCTSMVIMELRLMNEIVFAAKDGTEA